MSLIKQTSQKIIHTFEKLRDDYPRQSIFAVGVISLIVIFLGSTIAPTASTGIVNMGDGVFGFENGIIQTVFGNEQDTQQHKVRFSSIAKVHEDLEKETVEQNLGERSFITKVSEWVKDLFNEEDKLGIELSLVRTGIDVDEGVEGKIVEDIQLSSEAELSEKDMDTIGNEVGEMASAQNEVVTTTVLIGDEEARNSEIVNREISEGIDVVYQVVDGNKLKEDIIVKKIDAMGGDCISSVIEEDAFENLSEQCSLPKNQFTFKYTLDEGVELRKTLTGVNGKSSETWYLVDEFGRYLAHFEPLFAIDAEGNRTNNVTLEINNGEMTVTVDMDWMIASERVYPIVIDPTIIHDSLSEFNTGTYNRLESSADPKVTSIHRELKPDTDTLALWHMDETSDNTCSGGEDVCDTSGNGNHGTSSGTTITTTNAKVGDAGRYFNGSNANFSTPSVELGNEFTMEVWVYPQTGSSYRMIASNSPTSANTSDGFRFYLNNWGTSNRRIVIETSNGSVGYTNNTREGVYDLNEWTHIAWTVDRINGVGAIYVNGIDETNVAGIKTDFNTSATLSIGLSKNNNADYIGYMDEFRITKRILTEQEIKESASKYPYGVYTSEVIDMGADLNTIDYLQWDEEGVHTGDGETPYSSTSLIGHWNFNETSGTAAADSSGSGNGGTLNGMSGCTSSQDGCAHSGWTSDNRRWGDGAIMFDGSGDYVEVSNPSSFNFGTNNFTIEAWIHLDILGTQSNIMSKSAHSSWVSGGKQFFVATDNKLSFDAWGTVTFSGNPPLEKGRWYHAAVTHNNASNSMKIYLNGQLTASASTNLASDNGSHNVKIGTQTSGGGYWKGNLDNVRFYQRELSADELLANYQIGQIEFQTRTGTDDTPYDGSWSDWSPSTGESQIDSLDSAYQYNTTDTGLVAYYPLDETGDNSCTGGLDVCDVKGTMHGTDSGGSSIVDGKYAKSRYFDGSDDYISWTSAPWLDDAEGSFSAWINFNDYGTTYQRIFAKTSPSEWGGWDEVLMIRVRDDDHTIDYRVFVGNVEVFLAKTNDPIPQNEWVHIAVTVSTTNGTKIYVNGVEQSLTYTTGSSSSHYWFSDVNTGATETTLGCFREESLLACKYYFNGMIDEARIYDTDISADQVMDQYLEGVNRIGANTLSLEQDTSLKIEGTASKKVTTGAPKLDGDTVGLWHLEETSGSSDYIKDSSGNGNNAIPVGSSVDEGISGKARIFNGSSEYLDLGSGTGNSIFNGATGVTVEAWVNLDTFPAASSRERVFSNFLATDLTGIALSIYGDTGLVEIGARSVSTDGFQYTRSSAIQTNRWYHLVGVVDYAGDYEYLYIDGVLAASGPVTFTNTSYTPGTVAGTHVDTIGAMKNSSAVDLLDGTIDEVRVSNRIYTAEEVAEAYRSGRGHYFSMDISSTDFTLSTKMPFWITADRPGSYLSAVYGEEDYGSLYLPDDNVVGLWRLEEDSSFCDSGETGCIRDESGYSNDGSVGSSPYSITGKLGQALRFDGSSDFLKFGDVLDDTFAGQDKTFSIEAWVKPAATMTNGIIVAKVGDSNCSENQREFFLRLSTSSKPEFLWYGSLSTGNYRGIIGTTSITNKNHWYHIVATYDGSIDTNDGLDRVKVYVDGVEEPTSINLTDGSLSYIRDGTAHLSIGNTVSSSGTACNPSSYFNGTIDEVIISNVVRTADEVRQSYEIGLRTHPVTIDFGAKLQSGYLIANSSDYSFRIDGTIWGADDYGDYIYPGDTIIIKENVDGTEYVAQGTVSSVTVSTGAVTVSSWNAGSTFPSGGFTEHATAMKWQKEWVDIREPIDAHKNAVTRVNFNIVNGAGGRTIWIDDIGLAGEYLSTPNASSNVSSPLRRYIQYRFVLNTLDGDVSPYIESVSLGYSELTQPTNNLIMRHGKWFGGGVEKGFWWTD